MSKSGSSKSSPSSRPIKNFPQQPPAPKPPSRPPPSNAVARQTLEIARSPGGIDGQMMHPVKKYR
jgi:hypothetical protein